MLVLCSLILTDPVILLKIGHVPGSVEGVRKLHECACMSELVFIFFFLYRDLTRGAVEESHVNLNTASVKISVSQIGRVTPTT